MRLFNILFFLLIIPTFSLALEVTTTIPPLHYLLSEITNGVFEPNLIIMNNSPHHYQLRPKDAYLLQKSDLVFYISKEFEVFAKRAESEYWIELLPKMPKLISKTNEKYDVHIWLDPENAKKIVQIMVDGLSNIDEKNAISYRDNAAFLVNRINIAEQLIKNSLAKLPNKKYVVSHDAYQYFTDYFNIPVAIKLVDNDHNILRIKDMQNLQNIVGADDLACIIIDPSHRVKFPTDVLRSTKLITIDSLRGYDYTGLMYSVTVNFLECFK